MECRSIEIRLISASNLENVRTTFQMKVYAVVSIGENSETEEMRTAADMENTINPEWNYSAKYTVGESAVQEEGIKVTVKLYAERTLGDKYIGEVVTSIKQLYDQANVNGGSSTTLIFPVTKDSVVSQGELKLLFQFGDKKTIQPPPRWKKYLIHGTNVVMEALGEIVAEVLTS